MRFIPGTRNRRSVRLKEYGYVQAGAYFVTICTYNRDCLLGEVVGGEMRLNEYGEIARDEWIKTASIRANVVLDVFVIMPNHVHGIIMLSENVGATRRVAPIRRFARTMGEAPPRPYDRNGGMQPGSIGAIIGQFKSVATKRINVRRGTPGLPVWQRNYYERVLREGEVDHIREYIQNNPAQWEMDAENSISS
jgi:putative transposase